MVQWSLKMGVPHSTIPESGLPTVLLAMVNLLVLLIWACSSGGIDKRWSDAVKRSKGPTKIVTVISGGIGMIRPF
ncbi:unnamed protein product [Orchesella dallaii]|uniref:Uncharacterized protein n=1 Tax=Orchesella dallaii TaxID=48710 RepID=A0ABP1QZQ2_9HEXA